MAYATFRDKKLVLFSFTATLDKSVEKFVSSVSFPVVCDEVGRITLAFFIGDKFTEHQTIATVSVGAHDRVVEFTRTVFTRIFAVMQTRWSVHVVWLLSDVAVTKYYFDEEHRMWTGRPSVFVV